MHWRVFKQKGETIAQLREKVEKLKDETTRVYPDVYT